MSFVKLKVKLEKINSFQPSNKCYAISIGQITKDLPQLALSCYDSRLYIFNPDGKQSGVIDWSTEFTCLAIGDIKGKDQKCLISGSLNGVVRVIDTTGSLVWSVELEKAIKSLALGDFDKDQATEVLVAAQANTAILLKSNGEIIWRKQFDSSIVSALIADIEGNGENEAIVLEKAGKVHILDIKGLLKRTLNFGLNISHGTALRVKNTCLLVTTHQDILRIWDFSENPQELFKYKETDRIRILTSGKLFDSHNDSLVIMTKEGIISVMRAIVQKSDRDGKAIIEDEFVEVSVDLEELRPIILELGKSFGVAGTPISRLHERYLENIGTRVSYDRFYKDILSFQSSGQLGGRIDHFGTPQMPTDDLFILSTEKFFCMSCNTQFPILRLHYQCDQCLRFICEDCFKEREAVGFVECPFCLADATHFKLTS